ncbi:MAG: transglycosylase SLT domain-containing protein [Anaerolineales bacterium]|nr:transglycosylase SLT domain-containing protein [Anaerolineales bacterium]
MSSPRSVPPSARAAASSTGGGCLSGFLLPPLAVLLVGLLMAVLTFDLSGTTAPGDLAAAVEATPAIVPGEGGLSPVFTPEIQFWADRIVVWAAAAGLDPNLAATVMQIESCGDPQARSRAGAAGLFQVMPYHFAAGENPYDPATNALRGLDYLRRSLATAGGDPRLAFAGYNGGIGVIGRWESSWASETQRYTYWGNGIYAEAASGAESSDRLQEWLSAGGTSLCVQARARLGLP